MPRQYNITVSGGPDTRPYWEIDWSERMARAVVPFGLDKNGAPLNPGPKDIVSKLPEGRGDLWHWGEANATDAVVFYRVRGQLYLLMIERDDNHGWALPGGCLDKGETPRKAVARELREETGLRILRFWFKMQKGRWVDDPRSGKNAWMVTHPGVLVRTARKLPKVKGQDDARNAVWVPANNYAELKAYIEGKGGKIFLAHGNLLKEMFKLVG